MITRPTGIAILAALALVLAPAAPADAGPGPAQARVDAAAAAYEAAAAGSLTTSPELVYRWSVVWLDAQRELPLKGKALAAAADAHLQRMRALEAAVIAAVRAGQLRTSEQTFAAYYRAEAELWVERKGKR